MMLMCQGCGRGGHTTGPTCPRCGLYLVYPDPADPGPDEMPELSLGTAFHNLWVLSCDCAGGRVHSSELIPGMQFIERGLIKGRNKYPRAIDQCLAGLELLKKFPDTLEVAYLNQGWMLILPAAAELMDFAVESGLVKHPDAGLEDLPRPSGPSLEWILSEEAAEIEWDPECF